MAEFIFGRSAAKKTEYLLKAAKRQLEVDENKKVIVIVPEQQALYWDTLAARSISRRDALRIEVVSFTRLADSVFRRFGGVAKHYITDAEKTLIMWNAMVSVAPRLTVYGEVTRGERYAQVGHADGSASLRLGSNRGGCAALPICPSLQSIRACVSTLALR